MRLLLNADIGHQRSQILWTFSRRHLMNLVTRVKAVLALSLVVTFARPSPAASSTHVAHSPICKMQSSPELSGVALEPAQLIETLKVYPRAPNRKP